jgi:hypothetical protein
MIAKALLAALAILCGPVMPSARADEPAAPIEVEDETTRTRLTHDHGFRHLLDIMELVDSPVFTRNTFQLKYEWTEKAAGAAMGQFTFKPTLVFGAEREFALRIEAPLETSYPNSASAPTISGFASLTTTLLWAFYSHDGIRQAIGLELQWNTATNPAVGQPWIIEPVYVVAFRISRHVAMSVELNWQRSFGYLGTYEPVNTLQIKPTVTVALPAWFFVSVQDKTSWSLQDHNVGSLLKFSAGRFLTENKTVVLAVEYETALDPVAAKGTVFMVGAMLSYFFEW